MKKGIFILEDNKKFKLFKRKEKKDITPEEVEAERNAPKGIKLFFKLLKRNFGSLISLNLMMLFMVIPILAAFYIYLQGETTPSVTSPLYATLYGADLIIDSPATELLKNTFETRLLFPVHNSIVYPVIIGLGVLLAVTWGWQNVGSTYVLRSMVRSEPVFIWSDYFFAIKKNLKQGFVLGIIDFAIIAVLTFDIMWFSGNTGGFGQDVMYFCTVGLAILYIFMRFYLYIMLITFDLSILKMFKNALIFTTIGIKRNIMGGLGILLMAALNFALILLLLPMGVVVPLILPVFYFLSFSAFIAAYSAYPSIQKYMIDPIIAEQIG